MSRARQAARSNQATEPGGRASGTGQQDGCHPISCEVCAESSADVSTSTLRCGAVSSRSDAGAGTTVACLCERVNAAAFTIQSCVICCATFATRDADHVVFVMLCERTMARHNRLPRGCKGARLVIDLQRCQTRNERISTGGDVSLGVWRCLRGTLGEVDVRAGVGEQLLLQCTPPAGSPRSYALKPAVTPAIRKARQRRRRSILHPLMVRGIRVLITNCLLALS